MVYSPGTHVWIDGHVYTIQRQVLFNRPAYRVIPASRSSRAAEGGFVVDGVFCMTTQAQSGLYRKMLERLNRDESMSDKDRERRIDALQEKICHVDKYVWEDGVTDDARDELNVSLITPSA